MTNILNALDLWWATVREPVLWGQFIIIAILLTYAGIRWLIERRKDERNRRNYHHAVQ